MKRSINIVTKVTEDCNLACKYCYVNADVWKNTGQYQSPKTLEKLLSLFSERYHKINLIWHGGEPLLPGLDFYKEVKSIEDKFKRDHDVIIKNSMQTNGSLVTESLLEFLLDKDGLSMSIGIS